ncbi:hypothetical protein GH714_008171 [Hevea brasiliensis]|uniref:WRKY domain-containing protein n=1 Tax=Hevea brasiliensis TaxID=3981 RepID=A0A6A6LWF5_HEVBR|nr:hypothetical protein GH714_008171 [Hevea brasiliensis]
MEEDPQMYQTTYIGHHTCGDILKVPQIITTQDCSPWESYKLTSNSNTLTQMDHQHHPPTKIKQEYKEENPSDLTDNLSSLDSIIWKDLVAFESAEPGDLVASTEATSQSLDMDFAVNSIELDSDFHFDERVCDNIVLLFALYVLNSERLSNSNDKKF